MKKILVLAGKPIGTVEIIQKAKQMGYYTICTDYLPKAESAGKWLADESWDVSTAEVETIAGLCKEKNIDGIATGVHEFNINRMLDICELTGMPCYCSRETWKYCDNKLEFKKLCIDNGIPVANRHDYDEREKMAYPVITKPVDGSGSRGFHICNNLEELEASYADALNFSPGKSVLIEDYIPFDTVIIHYTMDHGRCIYSGMSDKISVRFASTGSSVMGIQIFPSKGEAAYLQKLNEGVCNMFEKAGFTNGPIWIEAFYDGKEKFIFNEMGYRFGGSLTYYPVYYFHQIDQLESLILNAMHEKTQPIIDKGPVGGEKYCILPVHVKAGKIDHIIGENKIKTRKEVYAYVPVHFEGDDIKDWGSAQQVFCYLHILFNNMENLKASIKDILDSLRAETKDGENLLFTLFDVDSL